MKPFAQAGTPRAASTTRRASAGHHAATGRHAATAQPAAAAVPARRRLLGLGAVALAGLAAAGCGFKLRGSAALPFRSLYTNFAPSSAVGAEFRRFIRVAEGTQLVDDPSVADGRLEVLGESREKEVVGFTSTGRPREYQLRLRFRFRVLDTQMNELLAPTEIILRRDITSSDIEIVAKQQEEELLYREMQADLVQQLLRRLAAIRR